MQYLQEDFTDLQRLFDYINGTNDVMSPSQVLPNLFDPGIVRSQSAPTRTEIAPGFYVATSGEVARSLRNLRRRMSPQQNGRALVERMRAEVRERERPKRDIQPQALQGGTRLIADVGGQSAYSQFQVDGWARLLAALRRSRQGQPATVAVTAPTGAGKTEVFQLPTIVQVGVRLKKSPSSPTDHARYAIVYPRVALAQDQISRVFRYVARARAKLGLPPSSPIIVGLQFSGIRSKLQDTLADDGVFERLGNTYRFKLLDSCPWCPQPNTTRLHYEVQLDYSLLRCPVCREYIHVSLSKDDHRKLQPHLMLTTAESLDRMYLDWDFREYLPTLHGVIVDEAHLFNQIYGAHAHNLFRRLRELVRSGSGRELAFIASSATVDDPGDFAARLFYGTNAPQGAVDVIDASTYPMELSGLEVLYFLQAKKGAWGKSQSLSTMIQTAMVTTHGIIEDSARTIIFADSLDVAGRIRSDLRDAEQTRRLWEMRIARQTPDFTFRGQGCPQSTPLLCSNLYLAGECWRGALGGAACCQAIPGLRMAPAVPQLITGSTSGNRAFQAPVIIGTSALEVGVDDPTVRATLHYRPPRTVFNFTQRRGRAGRNYGDVAYSIVVLGQKPSDFYYLIRRHRIIDGSYDVPLNPDNPVVRQIHDWMEAARGDVFQSIQGSQGERAGIWAWILSKVTTCPYITAKYGGELTAITNAPSLDGQRERFLDWIERGLQDAKAQLGAEWDIPQRKTKLTIPALIAILDDLGARFEEWLAEDIDDASFQAELDRLINDAGESVKQIPAGTSPTSVRDEWGIALESVQQVRNFAQTPRAQVRQTLQSGRTWFDFFSRLSRLGEGYNLLIFADAMRIVYQAMYFLHAGVSQHNCPSSIPVFVPDNYFGSIWPMRVELPGDKIASEPVTYLTSVFAPYKLTYRYEANSLYVLEARPIGRPDPNRVRLRPAADGTKSRDPNNSEVIRVRGIQLRALASDSRQAIGLCSRCLDVYDLARAGTVCRCGGSIASGTLYEDRVYTDTGFEGGTANPVSSTLSLLPQLRAWTTVKGSSVRFTDAQQQSRSFRAWLDPALHFDVETRGVQWRVPGLDPNRKEALLHAAGHVLVKAMASVVGVREDQLGYAWNETDDTVTVWERSEGGAGLCETFVEVLQRDPIRVYREMVAVVACPIYLAEQKDVLWQSAPANGNSLREYLSAEFRLATGDPALVDIEAETLAETAYSDPAGAVCSTYDGCPACVESNDCRLDSQPNRTDAWTIVQSLVASVPLGQTAAPLGPVLRADVTQGIEHVLVI